MRGRKSEYHIRNLSLFRKSSIQAGEYGLKGQNRKGKNVSGRRPLPYGRATGRKRS